MTDEKKLPTEEEVILTEKQWRDSVVLAELITSRLECETALMEFFFHIPDEDKSAVYNQALDNLRTAGVKVEPVPQEMMQ